VSARRLGVLAFLGAAALGIEWLGYAGGSVGLPAADLVTGLTFLACGLLVWQRRQTERIAVLFVATGVAWLLGTLAGSDVSVVSSVGSALLYAHRGPFVHLILAYPTGRLRSRLDGAVVGAAYVDGFVRPIAQNDVLTIALVGATVAAAAIRLRTSSKEARAARALVTAVAALVGVVLVLGSARGLAGTTFPSDTSVLVVYEAMLVIAAISLTAGLLIALPGPVAVADLVVELAASPRPGTLRETLARAVGDPSLEIGFWVGDSYIDSDGRPVTLPTASAERAVTRVEREGEPVAALVHDAALADDQTLADAVSTAARLTAANARLQAELRAQLRELVDSRRRIVMAGDAQRSRLERRLDRASALHLEAMRLALGQAEQVATPDVAAALAVVKNELDEAVVELHELARGIHPHTLIESGLAAALAELAATAPIQVTVTAPGDRYATSVETTAYFVCAEALANVTKYAHSDGAAVGVRPENGRLLVRISDQGAGGADPRRGSGLRGLTDRVEAVGGRLTVSSPRGGGTSVLAEIPLELAP
jgi:signal transduction histidine kinase